MPEKSKKTSKEKRKQYGTGNQKWRKTDRKASPAAGGKGRNVERGHWSLVWGGEGRGGTH